MPTPVEIFDNYLFGLDASGHGLGCRFHPIPSEFVPVFEAQKKVFNHRMNLIGRLILPARPIEIYADFLDNGICNAFADIFGGIGLVGITKGAVLLPMEMFSRMLSHPGILEGLGDHKSETLGPQHREGMPANFDEIVRSRIAAGQFKYAKFPICAVRHRIASVCYDLCQRFIAMHEIVHIVHGHVGYLRLTHGPAPLLEITPHKPSSALTRYDLDRQSCEIWADWISSQVVAGGFVKEAVVPGVSDQRTKLFLWGFAMYTLFRTWGLGINPIELTGDHPPTAIRFEAMMYGACRQVTAELPEIGDQFYPIIHASQAEAEKAIAYCGGEQFSSEDINDTREALNEKHIETLIRHHENVLSIELKKHAHVALEIN